MELQNYFADLERKVKTVYSIAEQAREKGLDPSDNVEIPLATSLAERVTGLISIKYPQIKDNRIVKRIRELEEKYKPLDPAVALTISEEIAKQVFCKFENLEDAMDAGIRIGLAYMTLGVVSSPLEGYTFFKLKKSSKGLDYIAPYYSGPIRSAGGTAAAFSLIIVDHLREIMGFTTYDPTEKEIKRYVAELYDYHERITNLQYLPTEEEIEFLAKNLPVQLSGEPSEDREVSNYKDLPRIETNLIRSGICLVLGEGLAQKAPKILKMIKKLRKDGFKLSAWDFLEEYVELHKKRESGKTDTSPTYLHDLVAGRPVLGHPSRSGSFRLRYGRSRYSGYSALSINPSTMAVLGDSIANGTQLKIELPTKGCAITSCNSINGPIVKLIDDSVIKLNDPKIAEKCYQKIKEIIYLGDLLIPYGDFANRNHVLMPCGFNEEYWFSYIKKKNPDKSKEEFQNVTLREAKGISKNLDIPLHPKHIFFWTQITEEQLFSLIDWLCESKIEDNKLILPYSENEKEKFLIAKRALELLGAEHFVNYPQEVLISKEITEALLLNLGIEQIEDFDKSKEKLSKLRTLRENENIGSDVLSIINYLCNYEIKDLAGTFIGARMGRPEKAKLRKLTGSPNVLFPVGEAGGRFRSVQNALGKKVYSDFPLYYCSSCNVETIYFICEVCGTKTQKRSYCKLCRKYVDEDPMHGKNKEHNIQSYYNRAINMQHYLDSSMRNLNFNKEEIPELIKGIKGTSSEDHVPENLSKGILRAMFGLHVNKDGTIRYDATELPATHFKPKEIRTSIEKLRKLGYIHDIKGKNLDSEEQILELKPHDVILPDSDKSPDEKAGDVFFNMANFLDNLLVRFYGLRPFFELKSKEDLIGHLVMCIAPHNCAGVVGRIIGFSHVQALLASPYIHAAMRRDCDGDEAAFTLLMDCLLNFSKKYLPAHRGGTQDCPLVLNTRIRANEVDDMVFDLDVFSELPLELYEAASNYSHPSKVKLEQIRDRLGTEHEFTDIGFTHDTNDINDSVLCSSYKTLATMQEKVFSQMDIAEKIRAVDESDVARLVITRHFIRDIKGNLRQFTTQQFRCVDCNEKYRRPPLKGNCLKCEGKIIFTVSEGTIIKYLEPAIQLAKKYNIPPYVKQSLELAKNYIESIFGKETEKQKSIKQWF